MGLRAFVLLSGAIVGPSALWATGALAQGTAPPAPVAPQAPPAGDPSAPQAPAAPLGESLTGMAKAEYAAARILFEDGDFQGALQKLKSSYDLAKDPRLLWNMAAAEKGLRHYSEVARLVERYLSEGGAVVTADDRAAATSLLETVRGFVTDLTVEVNEPDAAILVDEQTIGASPLPAPVHVDMGPHKIRVTKTGFVDFLAAQDLPGGQPFHITAALVAIRHEGKLRVVASAHDVIQIDKKTVGTGLWEGVLPSGAHALYVSATGKRPHETDVVVQDNDVTTVHVTLQDETKQTIIIEKGGIPAWVWITGSAVLVGGGVGAYLLLKPDSETRYRNPQEGTWGAVTIP